MPEGVGGELSSGFLIGIRCQPLERLFPLLGQLLLLLFGKRFHSLPSVMLNYHNFGPRDFHLFDTFEVSSNGLLSPGFFSL